MPATALIRALNNEEGEDTKGSLFHWAATALDRQHGERSPSLFGRIQRLLPAIDLSVP